MNLAERQAAVVAAVTGTGPVPDGFDDRLVAVAAAALLRKRAGEVAARWPLLAASLGPRWYREFADWARQRPTGGSLADGWSFAEDLERAGRLPALAAQELAERRADLQDGGVARRAMVGIGRSWDSAVTRVLRGRVRDRRPGS
jgi:hypothetical protein